MGLHADQEECGTVEIRVRMAAVDEEIWPTDPTRPKETAEGVGECGDRYLISVHSGEQSARPPGALSAPSP
jgi:hypothetical protein